MNSKFIIIMRTVFKSFFILCVFMLFLGIGSLQAQNESASTIVQKIDTYLASLEGPGFSGTILVAHKGQTIWSKGFQYANRETGLKNSPNTVFDIGSITKQFTAAGILKLEMQGKLSTEDKLADHLPGVPEKFEHISLHHLLTHSAGMPDAIGNDYAAITETEFVSQAFKNVKAGRIGKKYHYSNVGYSLLALVIEKVSQMSYEAYLKQHLFAPAGMMNTGYVLPNWNPEKIAIGYRGKKVWGKPTDKKWAGDGPYLHLKGNGGILSTVEDMYQWHLALESENILSKTAIKKFQHPHIKEDPSGRSFYGYGWAIFPTPRNTQLIAHNGGNGIFFADFWRYLSEDITIIVMTNNTNEHSESMASNIAGILLQKS